MLFRSSETAMEFSGYGAVFGNKDAYGDVIEPGAFAKFLADVKAAYERHGRCVIAVSEGIHDASGRVDFAAAKISAAPTTSQANDWLHAKRKHEGYIAALLDMPVIRVVEVATFYFMYNLFFKSRKNTL